MKFALTFLLSNIFFLSYALAEQSKGTMCELLQSSQVKDYNSCYSKTKENGFKEPTQLTADIWCKHNQKIPLNKGKCEESIAQLKESYKKIDLQFQGGCKMVPAFWKKCQPCLVNGSQSGCMDLQSQMLGLMSDFNKKRIPELKKIIVELDKLEKMGVEVAREYAENLSENEKLNQNPETANSPAQSAAPIGVSTPNEVIHAHNGMGSGQIFQLVDMVKNMSTITEKEWNAVDAQAKSPLIYEQISNSMEAKNLRKNLSDYTTSLEDYQAATSDQIVSLKEGKKTLVSSSLPMAPLGGLLGAAGASVGSASKTSSLDTSSSEKNLHLQDPIVGSKEDSSSGVELSQSSKENIVSKPVVESETPVILSELDHKSSSFKENLREKYGMSGRSRAPASKGKDGSTSDKNAKQEEQGEKNKLDFTDESLPTGVFSAQKGSLGQQSSSSAGEIPSSILETELRPEAGLEGLTPGTQLQAEAGIPSAVRDILPGEVTYYDDSNHEAAPLFLRVHECHVRSLKTGKIAQ